MTCGFFQSYYPSGGDSWVQLSYRCTDLRLVDGCYIRRGEQALGDSGRTEQMPNDLGSSRLLKNAHLRRCPHPSSLRRTSKYASLLRISSAFHPGLIEQPAESDFFSKLLVKAVTGKALE